MQVAEGGSRRVLETLAPFFFGGNVSSGLVKRELPLGARVGYSDRKRWAKLNFEKFFAGE